MLGTLQAWLRSHLGRRDESRDVIVSAHDGYPRWVDSGADFIEIDIRRTPDGVIVLAHDELEPGATYPTLEEVLDAACSRIGIQLDLKEEGYEVELMRTALARCPAGKVVLTTESPDSARIVKQKFPGVRVGITARDVKATNADFTPLDQEYASEEALDFCARNHIPVWVWTVDDERLMKRFLNDKRVAGIITNRPDRALRLIRRSRRS